MSGLLAGLAIFGSLCLPWFLMAAPQAAQLPKRLPLGLVLQAPLRNVETSYGVAVESLLAAYEKKTGFSLVPGERGKVGLKVDTRGGLGLSTPRALLLAVIEALARRGFERDDILIVDLGSGTMRAAGVLPQLSERSDRFHGCQVIALDQGAHYDDDWFYDSPLPPARRENPLLYSAAQSRSLAEGDVTRKSMLPAPLIFDVDFWFNLATVSDEPVLGIDGVLSNATLWSVSNSQRFLANEATASSAVAEIIAIPELNERMALHFVSLETFQFIGGPFFNAYYTRSLPALWMSSDPVALDRLMLEKINRSRRLEGFDEIEPLPLQLRYAASLDIGTFNMAKIRVKEVETP